jgi:adenylate cyclase class 2
VPSATEREVKLPFADAAGARAAVQAAGLRLRRARRLQRDTLFDMPGGRLSSARSALRLRIEPDACTVTWKGPPRPGPMKVREEVETLVGDEAAMRRVLEALDLQVVFRYEKYREEYDGPDVVVAIDETPVGTFVEIEGAEAGILATAAAMGRGPDDFVTESYRGLFFRHRERLGLTGPHMTFQVG